MLLFFMNYVVFYFIHVKSAEEKSVEKHGNIFKRNTGNTAVKVLVKSNTGVFQ